MPTCPDLPGNILERALHEEVSVLAGHAWAAKQQMHSMHATHASTVWGAASLEDARLSCCCLQATGGMDVPA